MLFLTIFTFAILLAIMYRINQNLLFPPVLFVGTWLISLLGIMLSGDSMFEVSSLTYLVYIFGAISFSIGGVVGLDMGRARAPDTIGLKSTNQTNCSSSLALDVALVVLVVGLPFYWREMSSHVSNVESDLLLMNIRQKMIELHDERSTFSLVRNLDVLVQFVAAAMFYEMNGSKARRWRAIAAAVLAIVYGAMSGTKISIVSLIMTFFFISSIKAGKIRVDLLLSVIGLSIVAFCVGLLTVNYAYISFADISSLFSLLGDTLQNYWLGGLVAFDRIVENPNIIESTQPIGRFFLETGRSFGMNIYVPAKHADYIAISNSMYTNVYTIYFSYFKEFGWIGTTVIMLILGVVMSSIYRKALYGGPMVVPLYSMMCIALILTLHAEHFFLGLNFYIKALIFFIFIYKILPLVKFRCHIMGVRHA
jgi:oligosaccharide repeat unit polymerase